MTRSKKFFPSTVLEVFSFLEILDLFIAIWKSRPEAYFNAAQIEAFKKEIIDLMDNLSKYSFGSLSKFSMESLTDSETGDGKSVVKLPLIAVKKLLFVV